MSEETKSYNIDVVMKNLDGSEIKEGEELVMLNKIIANTLIQAREGDSARNYSLAIELFKGGKELNDNDAEYINTQLKATKASPLVVGQFAELTK